VRATAGDLAAVSDRGIARAHQIAGDAGPDPLRVRIEKGHPHDPNFKGKPDPLHTVDHLHIDRRANGITGPWTPN
jgi:hypothetical protein